MIHTYWLYPFLAVGVLASGTFLAMHRPRLWFRAEAINASGWVLLMFFFYLRSLALLILGPATYFSSLATAIVSLASAALIDALLLVRVVSFIRFLKSRRDQRPQTPPPPAGPHQGRRSIQAGQPLKGESTMKLWGRDPVVLSNAAAALIVVFSALVLPLSAGQQTVLNAVVVAGLGLLAAIGVHKSDAIVPAVAGFLQAGLAVAIAFGWHLSEVQQAGVVAAIAAVAAIFLRPQLTAKYDGQGLLRS